jgi:hypothetical protein
MHSQPEVTSLTTELTMLLTATSEDQPGCVLDSWEKHTLSLLRGSAGERGEQDEVERAESSVHVRELERLRD